MDYQHVNPMPTDFMFPANTNQLWKDMAKHEDRQRFVGSKSKKKK